MTLTQLALLFTAKTDLRPSKANLTLGAVCVLLALIRQMPLFTPSTHIGGSYDKRFEAVAEAFRSNFYEGREREGAGLTVYHKGKLVVNLWGGYADRESGRMWQRDTKTMVYSATKAVASLCIAMQVDRGYLSYSDLVIKHWPEYGRNGKENTTVEDLMSHKAGLPIIEEKITLEDAKDFKRMAAIMEKATPIWTPGEKTGYHAITFGWLVDILMRKVDPKKRGVKQFFLEEIGKPYGIDFDIGVRRDQVHKVARMTEPGFWEHIKETLIDLRFLGMFALLFFRPPNSLVQKIYENPSWANIKAFNDPEMQQLDLPSVTGISDAQNFAKIFALAANETLLSNSTIEQLKNPTIDYWHIEEVVLYPLVKGYGFFYDKHPTIKGKWLIGHYGYGGQNVMFDPENQLAIAYVSNGLKLGTGELCGTYQRIQRSLYSVL